MRVERVKLKEKTFELTIVNLMSLGPSMRSVVGLPECSQQLRGRLSGLEPVLRSRSPLGSTRLIKLCLDMLEHNSS